MRGNRQNGRVKRGKLGARLDVANKMIALGKKEISKKRKKNDEILEIVLTFCFLRAIIAVDFLVTPCQA